ncbi:MAG: DHA2 family efflux MFS transporter permease subunit [Lactobacillaceae bacterium]|jgi:EmrB/QacA subfamily drug resistance transporter|nr:DHA2 family efflux MFS transporter permease subunit [Lactobacillaceae bacterium]
MTEEINSTKKLDPGLLKIALILAFGALAPLLDSTMVNIAIDTMTKDLHTTLSAMQWAVTGYTLMMGITVPLAGWATDRFNGKWVYTTAMVFFLVGSTLSGISTSMDTLLVGRVIQGAGAGLLMPALTTLLMRAANGQKLGKIMAIVAMPIMIAPVLGPTLGAIIVQNFNWHMMFWVNIPISIIAIILVVLFLPSMPGIKPKLKIDFVGIALLSGLFAALIIGVSNLKTNVSFFSQHDVVLAVSLAIVAAILYVVYALVKPASVIVSLKLFKNRNFNMTTLLLLVAGITTNGPMLILPLYMQGVSKGIASFGKNELLMSGIIMGAQAVGMFVTRTWAGNLSDSRGPRIPVMIGLAGAVVFTLPFVWIDPSTNLWFLAGILFLRGAFMGMVSVPLMMGAFVGAPKEDISQISVATRIIQNVGGSAGSAVLAMIVANIALNSVKATPVLTMSHAYNMGFAWSAGFSLLAIIPALFLASHKADPKPAKEVA